MNWNFGLAKSVSSTEFLLEMPFNFGMSDKLFKRLFIENFYKKVLTDCYHRTLGLSDEYKAALWDNSVFTAQNKGLITLLAQAMFAKNELYLVYKNKVVREADESEKKLIQVNKLNDYGVGINFTDYSLTDILCIFADMLFAILKSAHTGMNVAKSIQIGVSELRKTVAEGEKEMAIAQARAMNEALKSGKSVLKDAADTITAAQFDSEPMRESLEVFFGLMSFFTGFNAAYLAGDLVGGLSGSGEGNELALERALANYFNSVFKPCVDALFKTTVKFKSNNWRKLAEMQSLLPFIEATALLTDAQKRDLIDEVLN